MTEEEIKPTEEKPPEEKKKFKINAWMISSIVLVIVLIGVLIFFGTGLTGMIVVDNDNVLEPEEAAVNVLKFINENLVQPGTEASFVSVEDFEGIYNVTISYQERDIFVFVTKDGTYAFLSAPLDITQELSEPEEPEQPQQPQETLKADKPENTDIESFLDSGEDICYEDGKPIIRMYANSGCGFCKWNKPIYEKVVKEYVDQGKIVAYLWEDGKNILSDEQEAQPQEESALYQKYGFRGVPAFIFGCKYYRAGAKFSRVENGEELEEAELRTVIEDLLG